MADAGPGSTLGQQGVELREGAMVRYVADGPLGLSGFAGDLQARKIAAKDPREPLGAALAVANGLNVVAVRIAHKGPVVVGVILRAEARRTIVGTA